MAIDKLSDSQIRNSRPREKVFRIHDGLGLYLEVTPGGHRWWRFKSTSGGKEKRVARTENTFEAVAREWFAKRLPVWKQSHSLERRDHLWPPG